MFLRVLSVLFSSALVLLAAFQPRLLDVKALYAEPGGTAAQPARMITAVPTANPAPSRTPTPPPTNTPLPSPTPTPTSTATPTPTRTLFSIATNTPSPSAQPSATRTVPFTVATSRSTFGQPETPNDGATWTPPPPNPAVQIADHYMMARPLSNNAVNWADRTYPYGNTAGGRLQVHHGIDMGNPRGTPVLAAADGTVIHAGDDLTTLLGPYNNYYGNVVVIEHPFLSPEGLPVYSLYGHLDQVLVGAGAQVRQGDQIATVGGTGIAMGPHLHFEVRLGSPYDFGATRNPELWIRPYPTFGTLAGRVTDAAGNLLYDVTLFVESTDISRYAFSYADDSVNPDDTFGENFVLGDLPANYYTITVGERGRVRFRETVYVYPNRTTWVNVQLNN